MTEPASHSLAAETSRILESFGVSPDMLAAGDRIVRSPVTGETIGRLRDASIGDVEAAVGRAAAAFQVWRTVPGPQRGELVRLLGEELRAAKADLGMLVSIEVGKVVSEGLGEVQEMIDICDFAVGLSRQLLWPDDRHRADRSIA